MAGQSELNPHEAVSKSGGKMYGVKVDLLINSYIQLLLHTSLSGGSSEDNILARPKITWYFVCPRE